LLNFCQSALGKHTHGAVKFTDGLIGQAVNHKQSHFFGFHQARGPQNLQVLGGIGDSQAGFFGQNLDRSFPLAQAVQQFQSFRTGNRLADTGKLLIDGILKKPV